MEFWRHTWNQQDWHTYPYILTNFKNFGFVLSNGDEIDDTQYNQTGSPYGYGYTDIKYKYDLSANTNKNFFRSLISTSGDWYWGTNSNGGVNELVFYSDVTYYGFAIAQSRGYGNGGGSANRDEANAPFKTFFIPLKDKGFFFNARRNCDNGTDPGMSSTEPLDPDGYRNFGQTPKLITCAPSLHSENSAAAGRRSNCQTLIGLPPSQNSNTGGFIYLILNQQWDGTRGLLLSGHRNDYSLPCYESITGAYTNHTNINNNVCTLVRHPYAGGFLDNLYIMTTCPSTGFTDDIGFFSINGRNFMKPLRNLVVELPTN